MSISIRKIEENFDWMLVEGKYYEHPDVFPNKKASFSFDSGVLNKTCLSDAMVLHAGN